MAGKRTARVRSFRAMPARLLRSRFDSAATTDNNRRHWAGADSLSADAAVSADVRKILRERARYEVANNSYAKGIVLTLANDTVGTGPRLQMLTPDDQVNRRLEREFELWAHRVALAEKLRTMRIARARDGVGALCSRHGPFPTPGSRGKHAVAGLQVAPRRGHRLGREPGP